ncbi:MAG: RHS repeat-associated core domain-containing protein, partial [Candidatus Nealsonbacteria bacterium]|nr:RHS repeat-associated core domain-containing protein [Candidatus Nealsonbacteria bacterium]
YDPYGKVTVLNGAEDADESVSEWSVDADNQSDYHNPYLYTGRRLDEETGLQYSRARYYHATLGRFVNRDLIVYGGGMNLYSYVGGSPINLVDPLGLEGLPGLAQANADIWDAQEKLWELEAQADQLNGQAEDWQISSLNTSWRYWTWRSDQAYERRAQVWIDGLAEAMAGGAHSRFWDFDPPPSLKWWQVDREILDDLVVEAGAPAQAQIGCKDWCAKLAKKIGNITKSINKRLSEYREDPLGLPEAAAGDRLRPRLSRRGHRKLINMDRANRGALQALYDGFCTEFPNWTAPLWAVLAHLKCFGAGGYVKPVS